MEGRNVAQADRSAQPTNAKRALRSTTAAQASTVSTKSTNATKLDIKVLSQATRTHLEKEGFLKGDEPVTAMSVYEAFKKIFERVKSKCQPDAHTTLISFMMVLGELALQKEQNKGEEAERLAKQISMQIESTVEKGLQKLSNLIDVSLANHTDIQNSTKKLGEAAEVISKATEDVSKNLAVASDTSSKLTHTVSSYKDMLLATPRMQTTGTAVGPKHNPPTDPKISRDMERKAKQVLVDIYSKEIANQSLEELKIKFNKLIWELEDAEKPSEDAAVQQIVKLRNGGLILQFGSKEVAEWFRQPHIELTILPKIDETAMIKERSFQVLVPRVPTTFDTSKEDYLREIEEQNNIHPKRLRKAKWIKPIYRRTPGQQFAHLALTVSTPEDANIIIRDGLYICGTKMYPKKLKVEPKQCMKCRKWGHFANECLAEKDSCGNCGEDHMTKDCPDKERRYCVSCKNDSHASWDRECPEFKRRVDRMDEGHLENALTYFPTEEDWTYHSRPRELQLEERCPAKYAVASLPPLERGERKQTTRHIEGSGKRKQSRYWGNEVRGPMDNFLSQPRTGGQAFNIEEQDAEEVFNTILDEDITKHLNTAFNAE